MHGLYRFPHKGMFTCGLMIYWFIDTILRHVDPAMSRSNYLVFLLNTIPFILRMIMMEETFHCKHSGHHRVSASVGMEDNHTSRIVRNDGFIRDLRLVDLHAPEL